MSKEKKKHSRVGNVAASKKIKKKKAFVTKYIVPNSDYLTKVDRLVEPTNNSTINIKYIVPELDKIGIHKEETITKTTVAVSEVDNSIDAVTVTQESNSATNNDQYVSITSNNQEDSVKTKQETNTEASDANLNECITLSVTVSTDESKPILDESITNKVIEKETVEVHDVSINDKSVEDLPSKPKTYRDMMLNEIMTTSPEFKKPSNIAQVSSAISNQTTVAETTVVEPVTNTTREAVENNIKETQDKLEEDKPIDVASLFTSGVTIPKSSDTSKEVKVGLLAKIIKWFKKLFGLTK